MKQLEVDICKPGPTDQFMETAGSKAGLAPTDQQLLGDYAAAQSDGAFSEIVARHAGFVYAAALRQTENRTAAEEITQAVFVILARKASALRREMVLEGWLFRTVRYAVMDFRKREARRIRREQEAARVHSTEAGDETQSVWNNIAPLIDEALASLSTKDRQAILLRFFEEKRQRQIGILPQWIELNGGL